MKILVPSDLSDIRLDTYQSYLKVLTDHPAETEDFYKIKRIELFCNLTPEQVNLLQYKSIIDLNDRIELILNSTNNYIQKTTIRNIEFGFMPDLDAMSYGEFLDLNNNISDWDNMQIAMGVLYRPIVKSKYDKYAGVLYRAIVKSKYDKYAIEPYYALKYDRHMRQITMDVVVGAMVFFWNLGMDLATDTANYLDQEVAKSKVNLQQNGDGIPQLTNSLREMLQEMRL